MGPQVGAAGRGVPSQGPAWPHVHFEVPPASPAFVPGRNSWLHDACLPTGSALDLESPGSIPFPNVQPQIPAFLPTIDVTPEHTVGRRAATDPINAWTRERRDNAEPLLVTSSRYLMMFPSLHTQQVTDSLLFRLSDQLPKWQTT